MEAMFLAHCQAPGAGCWDLALEAFRELRASRVELGDRRLNCGFFKRANVLLAVP